MKPLHWQTNAQVRSYWLVTMASDTENRNTSIRIASSAISTCTDSEIIKDCDTCAHAHMQQLTCLSPESCLSFPSLFNIASNHLLKYGQYILARIYNGVGYEESVTKQISLYTLIVFTSFKDFLNRWMFLYSVVKSTSIILALLRVMVVSLPFSVPFYFLSR